MKINFILFVHDQDLSTRFYSEALAMKPSLYVPGMTEFTLGTDCVLGLMPESGIKRIIGARELGLRSPFRPAEYRDRPIV